MNQHGDEIIGAGYPLGQLAKAAETATTHPDPATRERAEGRIARWQAVLHGMLDGELFIGSRTPVPELPAWVTPEVIHGGFATGRAAAGNPLLQGWESAYADRHDLPHDRASVFRHRLEHATAAEGDRVALPEESVLPVLRWLIEAGDHDAATALLETVAPFINRLRFAPEPAADPELDPEFVWRDPAGRVRDALLSRGPQPRIATMRDTLTVWNLFSDDVLALWLTTAENGRVGVHLGVDVKREARQLLDRFAELAERYPPSRRHAGPKANLTVLRTALDDVLAGREWRRGLVQSVVDAMVARRGSPGSPGHRALRARQAADAALKPHHEIAHAVARRMGPLPQHTGVLEIDALITPVDGTAVPDRIRAILARATAAPVEDLIEAGLVPSAEVLARLVPRIAARTVADAYPDPVLRRIMAANHLAFRNRRSVLLTDLQSQVRPEELPWVRAVAGHRRASGDTRAAAAATLRRLGELTVGSFPGTLIPNPMVRELAAVSREAGLDLPWVEELAADIFDGRFSAKFVAAARIAGELLSGTIYEQYYAADYAGLPTGAATFAQLCRKRAGFTELRGLPAANGMIIEQAQILTTHNLATLVRAGVRFDPDGAEDCWAKAERLAGQPRPLAHAWREMVFRLAISGRAEEFVLTRPERSPLAPALDGLIAAVEGRPAKPLTGWRLTR
ncbi:hypothetical protein ACTI_75910 [Actinoplanes sp. OR16]|uniref:hypothetical protein n=1 Tax=Actinoplanes sp. OR16 TaxID=946334 RepID=UPI000F715309|nr:hypothetical protein [Actinoplanes sp. OR16]BBH70906.1 hypothetical protein ACTI_75910 [Actinoplanes sp. OR16]